MCVSCGRENGGKLNIKVNRTCGICHTIASTIFKSLTGKVYFQLGSFRCKQFSSVSFKFVFIEQKGERELPPTTRLYFSNSFIVLFISYLTWCPSFQSNNSVAVLKIYADKCWKNRFGLRVQQDYMHSYNATRTAHNICEMYLLCCFSIPSMKHGQSLMKRCILAPETQ